MEEAASGRGPVDAESETQKVRGMNPRKRKEP
jgi:hypothetical protein